MKKFVVFSGFLGSGKTTTMMALTRYYSAHYGRAAMISNDLGTGVTLADHKLAQLEGCNASQITDACICFCRDVLKTRLNGYFDEGCELVVSDIPGFGVGAQEHVYHGLTEHSPGQFALGPFTVLIEPRNLSLIRSGEAGDMGIISLGKAGFRQREDRGGAGRAGACPAGRDGFASSPGDRL